MAWPKLSVQTPTLDSRLSLKPAPVMSPAPRPDATASPARRTRSASFATTCGPWPRWTLLAPHSRIRQSYNLTRDTTMANGTIRTGLVPDMATTRTHVRETRRVGRIVAMGTRALTAWWCRSGNHTGGSATAPTCSPVTTSSGRPEQGRVPGGALAPQRLQLEQLGAGLDRVRVRPSDAPRRARP